MTPLGEAARRECLYLCRRVLHEHVRGQRRSAPYEPGEARLRQAGGAFVTLRTAGRLRGCIGHITADAPLWRTLSECTVAAASQDPRFSPVRPEELPGLTIEISVLSPLTEVPDPAAIQPGHHGLLVSRGGCRGLLLPQVATEQGWDRETFLAQTCRKAGLPPDAWRQGARLEWFTADRFGEGGGEPAPTG